jgi:hypothetical protein
MAFDDTRTERLAIAGAAAIAAGLLSPWLSWPWAAACLLGLPVTAWSIAGLVGRRK